MNFTFFNHRVSIFTVWYDVADLMNMSLTVTKFIARTIPCSLTIQDRIFALRDFSSHTEY